jgi:hypothetical protein
MIQTIVLSLPQKDQNKGFKELWNRRNRKKRECSTSPSKNN